MRPTNPLKRTNYFDGQLLTAADLARDQAYFRDRLRRHNSELHGWGVVWGLGVEVRPDHAPDASVMVIVSPGYALSPEGDEIFVGEVVSRPVAFASKRWTVALRFGERLVDPIPTAGPIPANDTMRFRAVEETCVVDLFEAGLPDSDDRWVVLAEVSDDESGHAVIDTSARQHARKCG